VESSLPGFSSTIIEDILRHCQTDSAIGFAYFYFDFNDRGKQCRESFLRSLITQLSVRNMETPKALSELYSRHQDRKNQPTIKELTATLKAMTLDFSETYIIVDALDESCGRDELLELITEMNGWKEGHIHMLATSRKERDIEEALKDSITREVCIHNAQVDSDIQLHVRMRLQNDPKLRKWGPKIHEEIEKVLMNGACGM